MLVLSRRLNETIVFPDLNISVQVVGIKSGSVRLGITAPPEVGVRRGELPDRKTEWGAERPPAPPAPQAPPLNQIVRRRLQVSRVGLAEVQRLLRAGRAREAQELLEKLDEDVALLQRRLEADDRTAGLGCLRTHDRPEVLLPSGRELGRARNRLRPATASNTTSSPQATRSRRPGAPRTGRARQGT